MKRIFLLGGILLLLIESAKTQNLVIDGDFENFINIAGTGQGGNYLQNSFISWYKVNVFPGNYYNKFNNCSYNSIYNTTTCGVPYHGASGFQYPRSGNGYASLFFGSFFAPWNKITSAAIGGSLSENLKKHIKYCGGFYLNHNYPSQFKCNGYGIAFTKEKIDTGNNSNPTIEVHMSYLNYQIKAPIDLYIGDTLSWVQVADTFSTQSGSETYFVISNYLPKEQIQFISSGFNVVGGYVALYYIDDVFVYEQKPIWVYGGDVSVCDTVTYVLKAEQAPEFVWWEISQPGVWLSTRDTLALPPGVGGTYVVRGEACGYVTYDTVTVTRLNCGLSMPGTVKDELLLSIYPNPASASFTLQLTAPGHVGGTLHISDMNGRRLASHLITQANSSISTEALATGIYSLAYERPDQLTWRGKLCVNR